MGENIDITKLGTPDLIEIIQNDLFDGLADMLVASVEELLSHGVTPKV